MAKRKKRRRERAINSLIIVAIVVIISVSIIRAPSPQEGSKGILYEISGGSDKAYLFGTLHLGTEEMYPLDNRVTLSLERSDILVLEIDMSELSPQDLMTIGVYDFGEGQLSEAVSEETFDTLHDILAPFGIDEHSLDTFKPWYVESLVSESLLHTMGFSAEAGVEDHLDQIATSTGMDVIGLEDIESQMRAYDRLSDETQVSQLKKAIEGLENGSLEEQTEGLITAWIEGDRSFFERERSEMIERPDTPSAGEFAKALLHERDEDMAETIAGLIEDGSGETYFIAVGTLHLVGEGSIIENLEEMGHSAEKII